MEVKNFWSKEDDEKLKELWPIKTSYQLMDIFGRSRNSDEIKNEPFIGVHLLDIKRDQCRYMHDSQSLMFCGHKVANGSSYCESHHKYMFTGRISLDDREQRYFAK